jgi:hypothetical protein
VKTRIVEPTKSAMQDATAATAPYREPRCKVCDHAIGAHFTSPAHCQVRTCPCTGYVASEHSNSDS